MARRGYAGRYAQATFEIAREREELDKWQADLRQLVSLGEDTAVVAFLESPKVQLSDKARLLSEQLGDVNPLALNLIYLLISRGRLDMINNVANEYQRLFDSYHGIERAEVVTAVPLDKEDEKKLSDHLGALTGKKVIIEPEIDTGLIGGFVARIGGKLIDGSTHGQLQALKSELAGKRG